MMPTSLRCNPVHCPVTFSTSSFGMGAGYSGSPLSPERFAWVHEHVKVDVHLASISGGTCSTS